MGLWFCCCGSGFWPPLPVLSSGEGDGGCINPGFSRLPSTGDGWKWHFLYWRKTDPVIRFFPGMGGRRAVNMARWHGAWNSISYFNYSSIHNGFGFNGFVVRSWEVVGHGSLREELFELIAVNLLTKSVFEDEGYCLRRHESKLIQVER